MRYQIKKNQFESFLKIWFDLCFRYKKLKYKKQSELNQNILNKKLKKTHEFIWIFKSKLNIIIVQLESIIQLIKSGSAHKDDQSIEMEERGLILIFYLW